MAAASNGLDILEDAIWLKTTTRVVKGAGRNGTLVQAQALG